MTIKTGNRPMQMHLTALCLLLAIAQPGIASDSHSHSHNDHQQTRYSTQESSDLAQRDHASDGEATTISAAMAARNGISSEIAGPGKIERHLQVYGRLELPPDQRVALRARFAGLVKSVRARVGQSVDKGEVLAVVESNDSLKDYAVVAPISGIIQSRQTSVGEISGNTPLFTVVDTRRLWATLQVFSSQRFEVKPGLPVHVIHNNHRHNSHIESIAPADQGEPYVIARVMLDNANGDMAPGDLVSAEIDAEIVSSPLVIKTRAIQQLDGRPVVFIQEGERYYARALEPGRTDGVHTEVLSGLDAGDRYVVDNSYLIKADIEKSAASHEH